MSAWPLNFNRLFTRMAYFTLSLLVNVFYLKFSWFICSDIFLCLSPFNLAISNEILWMIHLWKSWLCVWIFVGGNLYIFLRGGKPGRKLLIILFVKMNIQNIYLLFKFMVKLCKFLTFFLQLWSLTRWRIKKFRKHSSHLTTHSLLSQFHNRFDALLALNILQVLFLIVIFTNDRYSWLCWTNSLKYF